MPRKRNFFDYEPLTRQQPSKLPAVEEFGLPLKDPTVDESGSSLQACVLKKGEVSSNSREHQSAVKDPPLAEAEGSQGYLDRGRLKRGHAVSFAGIFLFTFLLFFRPYEFSPSLLWLSSGALITAIITFAFYIPTQLGLENRLTIRPREVNLVLLLLLLGLISVPLAVEKTRAWNSFVEFIKVVAVFIVLVNVLRTKKRLYALLLVVIAASCVLSIAAVRDYSTGHLGYGQRIIGAIGGLFDNPNDLALHLVTMFPIIVCLALGARGYVTKILLLAAGVIVVLGTVVTFSRGGFIGLMFVVAALVWRLGGKNRFAVGSAAVFLMILFFVLSPGAYRERIATTGDESAAARTGELKRSVYIALRHPLFGVGMDNFVVFSNTEHATHNAYTQVASEIGLPATVAYVLFLITSFKRPRRIPQPKDVDKKSRGLPYLAIGLQASMVGYMATSFFASVAYLWYVYYLAAYIICIDRLYQASLNHENSSGAWRASAS